MKDEPTKYDLNLLEQIEDWIIKEKFDQFVLNIPELQNDDMLLDDIKTSIAI